MKKQLLIAGGIALVLLASAPLQAADAAAKFYARSGSKMRIEGTSNIHDWQVESPIIGGFLEAGANFPCEPGQAVTPGKTEARAEAFVRTRSLISLNKDGSHYSDPMDEIMWGKINATNILYRLKELTLKAPAKAKDAPYVFDAKGEVILNGVTNAVSMPVNILPLGEKKLKITGTVTLKMTDFKIEPPAPKIALGFIKTGDEVKLIYEWIVAQRAAPAAAK